MVLEINPKFEWSAVKRKMALATIIRRTKGSSYNRSTNAQQSIDGAFITMEDKRSTS
jgi:hypothetical protein